MGKYPYMPFYPMDYFADTADLTFEEHGFYLLLLALAWTRNGDIPNDMKWLKGALPASDNHGHKLNKLMPVLHRFFTLGPDNLWRNKRITAERSKVEKRATKGRQSADKRWAPHNKFKEIRDGFPLHPEQNIKNISNSEPSTRAAERDIEPQRGPARGGGFRALQDILSTLPNGPPIK